MAKESVVKVFISAVTEEFEKGLKGAQNVLDNFKTKVGEAEGASGKMKAGFSAMAEGVKANAGAIALTAGAALVGFGIKAAHAFEETAKAAIDLSTATGLSTEQASKWIAVGDDFQVEAQALQTGLGKIAKTLDDTKWKEYGIDTRDAAGEARPVNDILLDTFDMLSKVTNETERARIGQELFGKGYQSLTPILGHTRAEYEKMLGTVSAGQTITEKEAKKAERLRLAEDQLQDALKDVTLAVGQLASRVGPMVERVAEAVEVVTELESKFGILDKTMETLDWLGAGGPIVQYNKAVEAASDEINILTLSHEELIKMMDEANVSTDERAALLDRWNSAQKKVNGEVDRGKDSVMDFTTEEERAAKQTQKATDKLNDQRKELEKLRGELSNESGWLDFQQGQIDAKKNQADLDQQFKDGKISQQEYWLATAQGSVDSKQKALDFLGTLDILDNRPDVITSIITNMQNGDVEKANAEIEWWQQQNGKSINLYTNPLFNPQFGGGAGKVMPVKAGSKYAGGTNDAPGGAALVGENGAEIVDLPAGSAVTPAARSALRRQKGGGGNTNVFINLPVGTDPKQAAEVARRYAKRNGRSF